MTSIIPSIPTNLGQRHRLQAGMKQALTGGVFIDTKFYAFSRRHTSGSIDTPLPLYANSSILKAASPFFETLLATGFQEGRRVNIDRSYPTDQPSHAESYGYESDSDLENDEDTDEDTGATRLDLIASQELQQNDVVGLGAIEMDPIQTGLTPSDDSAYNDAVRLGKVVYIRDAAYITWSALIFYIFTGEVAFKKIRSASSPETRQNEMPQQSAIHAAPLCSPKSMYRLADIVGLEELKKNASDEIASQLSSQNCLVELFSTFTSWYPTIRDMEVDCTYRCGRESIAALPALVKNIYEGMLPHSGDALETLLHKLLESRSPSSPTFGDTPPAEQLTAAAAEAQTDSDTGSLWRWADPH